MAKITVACAVSMLLTDGVDAAVNKDYIAASPGCQTELLNPQFFGMLIPQPYVAFAEYLEESLFEWGACVSNDATCQPTFAGNGDLLVGLPTLKNTTARQNWADVCHETARGHLVDMPDFRFTVPALSRTTTYSGPLKFCVPRACLTYLDFRGPPAADAIMNELAFSGIAIPGTEGTTSWATIACGIVNDTLADTIGAEVTWCAGGRLEFSPWLRYEYLALVDAALFVVFAALVVWVLLAKAPPEVLAAVALGGDDPERGGASPSHLINEPLLDDKNNNGVAAAPPHKSDGDAAPIAAPTVTTAIPAQEPAGTIRGALAKLARAYDPVPNFHSLFSRPPGAMAPLDGLRAWAVLWVIIFHLDIFWPSGLIGGNVWSGEQKGLARLQDSWWWQWVVTGDMGVDVRRGGRKRRSNRRLSSRLTSATAPPLPPHRFSSCCRAS
jgi:hypothetical protein